MQLYEGQLPLFKVHHCVSIPELSTIVVNSQGLIDVPSDRA